MNDYNQVPAECEAKSLIVSQTLTERLRERQVRLALELKEVNEALAALSANPEICRVLTLVGKAIGRSL